MLGSDLVDLDCRSSDKSSLLVQNFQNTSVNISNILSGQRTLDSHISRPTKRRMSRADSAIDGKGGSIMSIDKEGRSSTSSYSQDEQNLRPSRPATSAGRHDAAARESRQRLIRQNKPRSRSIHSSRTKRERPSVQRGHSTPVSTLSTLNVSDAIALHERSCQLINMYHNSSANQRCVTVPMQQQQRARATSNYSYASHPRSVRTQSFSSPIAAQQPEPSPTSLSASDAAESREPVQHWTSMTTRRKEYAEIDKQNRGLRRLMRKLVPACLAKKSSRGGFYSDGNDSDCGSVRRYRLELPDEKKI